MTERDDLRTAHEELAQAASEACSPAENHIIDALLALLVYVARLPPPPEPKSDDNRESIRSHSKTIAARHSIDVTALLIRMELAIGSSPPVALELTNNETRFLIDLITALGIV
jgi:hypothetical protein